MVLNTSSTLSDTLFDTLIVSDTHLGSPSSMARELHQLLSTARFKRLILLGDIFADLNFSRLTKEHWKVISLIRKLSNPKRGVEVIWVEGNHDGGSGVSKVMRHVLGVTVLREYQWEWDGKRCLALHGHQFDSVYASGNPWFNGIVTELYILIQRITWVRKWLPKILDKFHTRYQRLTAGVAEGAFHLAAKEGADYVFCGHTHDACVKEQNGVVYWNVGCWVNGQTDFVVLYDGSDSDSDGVVELRRR